MFIHSLTSVIKIKLSINKKKTVKFDSPTVSSVPISQLTVSQRTVFLQVNKFVFCAEMLIAFYRVDLRPILIIYLQRQSSIVRYIYPISRLDRYMEPSKMDVGDRLLILGVRSLMFQCLIRPYISIPYRPYFIYLILTSA